MSDVTEVKLQLSCLYSISILIAIEMGEVKLTYLTIALQSTWNWMDSPLDSQLEISSH